MRRSHALPSVLLVYVVGFQLNDVIAPTARAIKGYDIIHQVMDLREYAEYDYKTGSEAF